MLIMKNNEKSLLSADDIISLLPVHVYQKDKNGVYLTCSDLHARFFGYSTGRDIVGKCDRDLLGEEQANLLRNNDIQVMKTKKTLKFEETVILPGGEELTYISTKAPVFNKGGEVIGILGVSVDITLDKTESENTLLGIKNEAHKREQSITNYYENLIALIPANVYWMNRENVFLGCNDQQARLAGLKSRYEIVGKTNYDMPWKKQAKALNALNNKVMETGIPHIAEEKAEMIFGKTAKEGVFLSQKMPLFDDDGVVIGLLGVSIDITDRKRAEEYRRKCEAEAAKKTVNFSNLVAGSIAHELKNPLAGIRMQMEVLRTLNLEKIQPKEASPIIDDVTSAIIKTVDNTNYFINGMLKKVRTFATGEAHHTAFEQLSITADVEDLLATYPFTKNEQDLVKTAFNIRFKYLGDKILTGHVLSNLMKNALHAIAQTDKEDATITIETKEDPSGKFNLLIFRDTATGIPADFVEKIFDQFETKKDVHGGTGLGLAFCKAVMKDNYGGDITCTSKEGEFTEFVLKFPKL